MRRLPGISRRTGSWVLLLLAATLIWLASPAVYRGRLERIANAATFSVTNTNDDGSGSLRKAIADVNANGDSSGAIIDFNIPGAGVHTITPLSPLPEIASPVTIDGFTQPGAATQNPLIELNGSSAGANAPGLSIAAGNCKIYGLVINRFGGSGISLPRGSGNLIAGNRIGTDAAGNVDRGNARSGIDMLSSFNNTIRENLISGNDVYGVFIEQFSSGNTLTGNLIGTNAGATGALGNLYGIVNVISPGNVIGPDANGVGAGNIIAGNTEDGLYINGDRNFVRGNYIGNNGTIAIPNGHDGIFISSGGSNMIGGTSPFAANVISGNGDNGIKMYSLIAVGNQILGNRIGVDATTAMSPLPNGANGIFIDQLAAANIIGGLNTASSQPQNFIAYNKGAGIRVATGEQNQVIGNYIHDNVGAGVFIDVSSSGEGGTSILGNRIFNDGGLGIDLAPAGVTPNDTLDTDFGPNDLQNFPILSSAVASQGKAFIHGALNSKPNSTYRLEFFVNNNCDASGSGEAEGFIGFTSVTTNGSGNVSFEFTSGNGTNAALAGQVVSATATDTRSNTSELSPCLGVQDAGVFSFASASTNVAETSSSVTVKVNRSTNPIGSVSVDYATADGQATAGSDYTAVSGTLAFGTNETQKSITVPILNDSLAEGIETFQIKLSNPKGGSGLAIGDIQINIDDDETPSGIVYALTDDNHLVNFNTTRPDAIFENRSIVGEKVYAIDFRPATGQLYALGVSGHLYTVNLADLTLQQVGTSVIPNFGAFDFNPVTDRIRVANENGNVEVNPDTGAIVATDTPLHFSPGDPNSGRTTRVLGLAHSNNVAGATSTTTYGIHWTGAFDSTQLVTVGTLGGSPTSPNSGLFFTVGETGAVTADLAGFDISDTGEAFATMAHPDAGAVASFYKVNLASGSAQRLGLLFVPNFSPIRDIAVQPAERVQFKSSIFSVNENVGTATITVTRTSVGGFTIVDYATGDGTATADADYVPASGDLVFAPGEKSKTFAVTILDDSLLEGVESVNLSLTVVATDSGGIAGTSSAAQLAIMDEPTEVGTNPIDNAEFFVRQHYSDFLSRAPDTGGLEFWTNHITQCFNDSACVNDRRVGTSVAFFVENEFQQTGFFIHRFYRAALNRRPSFVEFTADRGKVVGGANLESGKQAFSTEFVQRPDFLQLYPASLDAGGFVDALLMTATQASGITDLGTRRAGLLTQYNQGANQTDSRARVVRLLIDDSAFAASQYNSAFVLMQYFGYLQRGPDQAGYDFWLDHVNNRNPNNYRSMVCAFITSTEYQRRFGQIITRSDHDCAP